jgi:hypothetical protein
VTNIPVRAAGRLAPGPADTQVTFWDEVASRAAGPREGWAIYAYVGIAVYDSVMSIGGSHAPFAIEFEAPAGSSPEAAVAAAAYRVLEHYLPDEKAATLDPAYSRSLATIADGRAKANGIAVGAAVADLLIAQRLDDGFRDPGPPYEPPDPATPGLWIPTDPSPPYFGLQRPFALGSADQFRPAGPPALDSERWARDHAAVKELGSTTSSTRSREQTAAAQFWTQAPVQQARGAFRTFVRDRELSVADASRFMAMMSVTYADCLIACFDAKWLYRFWRPITAIRAGATDGNDATAADPTWSSLAQVTPNHPEYPNTHASITSAAGLVIERFLGTEQIDFTVPSLHAGVADRHFRTPDELIDEVANAPVWGGTQFPSGGEDGARMARATADYVLSRCFQRTKG